MKTIIDGKKYDTDTARWVGCFDNRYGNFSDYKESLYLKKTGEFFLDGEGGPSSKYAQSIGNMSGSGYGIIPLSINAARNWVEKHCSIELYEELFGETPE